MSRQQFDFAKVVAVTPVVDTAIYASGDLIGGKLTLTDLCGEARTMEIVSVLLTDLAAQNSAIDIIFFNADPTGTTFTDNAALDIADADLTKVCAIVKLLAANYAAFADSSAIASGGIEQIVQLSGSQDLYAALVSRGTPTYVAASDLQLKVAVQQH